MKGSSLALLLLVVGISHAQYNYQPNQADDNSGYDYNQPTTPRGVYLPPSQPPPPPRTTKKPYESEANVAAEGLGPDDDWQAAMPYDFTYAVKDDYGNDFSHQADSDGEVVKGEYKTLLPDGRTQIVRYTADWKNGYNAEVIYEGEAVYPEEKPQPTRAPYVPPPTTQRPYQPPPTTQRPYQPPVTQRVTQRTRNPYENEEDIDSQGLYPSTTRAPYVPPPTTTRAPYVPPPTTYRTTTLPPYRPPQTYRTTTRPPPPPPTYQTTTRAPYVPPPPPTTYRTTTLPPYRPPQTFRTTTRPPPPPTQPPVEPPGLYGAPSVPFGVRNNRKFGYDRK